MASVPMTPAVKHALSSGKRFNPSPEEAINFYLRRRVVGEPLPRSTAGVIHEEEVYGFEPKVLTKKYERLPRTHNRFFFTTCKRQRAGKGYRMSRAAAGPGSWVGTDKKDVKSSADQKIIGSHETLKYVYKDKSRKSDWRMDEYRCCGMDQFAVDENGRERVFCRLYIPQNSLLNSKKNSVTLQESLAGDPKHRGAAAEHESATAMAVQQQLPRRQEQVAHVLPAITQPQAINRPPPPQRALDLSSGPRQPGVTNTQQTPMTMRPAPQRVEPPCPKRMRPTLAPLKAPLPSRPAMPQQQASPSPWATPRRISPRSRRVALAPSPWPAAEATTTVKNGDDLMSMLMRAPPSEEDHAMIQEEAGNHDDDDFNSWVEGLGVELEEVPAVKENGGNIQEEACNDDDGFLRQLEAELEEEVPAVLDEHGGKIQEEGQHNQHPTSVLEAANKAVESEFKRWRDKEEQTNKNAEAYVPPWGPHR